MYKNSLDKTEDGLKQCLEVSASESSSQQSVNDKIIGDNVWSQSSKSKEAISKEATYENENDKEQKGASDLLEEDNQ